MKKQVYTSVLPALLMSLFFIQATSQTITTPEAASPAAGVSQKIGISTITVNYSRPSVRGRAIWGALVPYGWNVQSFGNVKTSPWRAGANENTTIQFSHDVTVEGKKLPAGTYGLFFVINEDNTGELILSKDYKSWGSFWYEEKQDALRAKIKLNDIPQTELLTYEFIKVTKNSAFLVLNWEKKQFPVKIEFAVDEIVMANAAEELKGPTGFSWQGYASAASYALKSKTNYEQALQWIDKAIEQNKSFATLSIKSGILNEMGKTAEADKLIQDGLTKATEVELNNYGYQLIGQGKTDKAIEVFLLNTQKNPKSANCWDSLGEAYVAKGDKKSAIASFKKSLNLNPPAGVKASSEKNLKALGVM